MLEVSELPVHKDMPDPMILNSGERVTTPRQWQRRREEMKEILEHYFLGQAPPAPGNVTGEVVESKKLLDGTVAFDLVRVRFGPEQKLTFELAIFTPANATGPLATIVHPTFHPTPGTKLRNSELKAVTSRAPTSPRHRLVRSSIGFPVRSAIIPACSAPPRDTIPFFFTKSLMPSRPRRAKPLSTARWVGPVTRERLRRD